MEDLTLPELDNAALMDLLQLELEDNQVRWLFFIVETSAN